MNGTLIKADEEPVIDMREGALEQVEIVYRASVRGAIE